MKLGIINSALNQAGVDTVTGLEHIARIGFDCVDLFTEADGMDPHEEKRIAETCAKHQLPITSLVVVAIRLIDFNDLVRAYHIARTKKFIDLAARLKAKNILLVLGNTFGRNSTINSKRVLL